MEVNYEYEAQRWATKIVWTGGANHDNCNGQASPHVDRR
jgi:hypothetical protein